MMLRMFASFGWIAALLSPQMRRCFMALQGVSGLVTYLKHSILALFNRYGTQFSVYRIWRWVNHLSFEKRSSSLQKLAVKLKRFWKSSLFTNSDITGSIANVLLVPWPSPTCDSWMDQRQRESCCDDALPESSCISLGAFVRVSFNPGTNFQCPFPFLCQRGFVRLFAHPFSQRKWCLFSLARISNAARHQQHPSFSLCSRFEFHFIEKKTRY